MKPKTEEDLRCEICHKTFTTGMHCRVTDRSKAPGEGREMGLSCLVERNRLAANV